MRSVLCAVGVLLGMGCDGPDPFATSSGAGNGSGPSGSTGSGTSSGYPLTYEGFATVRRTYAITFDAMNTIECHGNGAWIGTVTADEILIEGQVDQVAIFDGSPASAQCAAIDDFIFLRGTHDGERFRVDFMYESTPVTMLGSFGDELLGDYDASYTGVVAGFGEVTKTEYVSLALPSTP